MTEKPEEEETEPPARIEGSFGGLEEPDEEEEPGEEETGDGEEPGEEEPEEKPGEPEEEGADE